MTEPLSEAAGEMRLTVYPAEDPAGILGSAEEYDNDMSLVMSLRYKERSFLLTGDIEKRRIEQMLSSDTDWRHDWIKMPHHGRYEDALSDLMKAVSPEYAVICCSEKHPADEETRELLQEAGTEVYDTREQAVVTWCDGKDIIIRLQ